MSSARSITAARNRRAGDPSPKLQIQPPTRPVTSISSQSAFSQNGQQQQQQQQQQQNKGNNIRVSGKQSTVAQPKPSNGLPFSKLTISDAIGLVTLRLGRIEQFVMEIQENGLDSSSSNIPENSKLVDNSVLTSIINRLDSLEKKEVTYANIDKIAKMETDVANIKLLLESFTQKLDEFEININEKFLDYESAIIEIENCLPQLANNTDDTDSADNTDNDTLLVQGLVIVGNNVVNDDSVTISAEI
jgi:hypothetical protein